MALGDNVASAPEWRLRAEVDGDRSARARAVILGLVLLYLFLFLTSLGSGASDTSFWSVFSGWLGGGADSLPLRDRVVIWDIRLPRVVLGSLIGASLAVSGAVMQGLFRNPLADPGIVGVGSGAGLGAITVIVLGNTVLAPVIGIFGIYALPLAAFFGGVVSTLLLYRVATRRGQTSIATMLLAGIALGALAGALSGILVYLADDQELRDLTFWGLGSLAGASWAKIWASGPIILAALAAAPFLARGLDAMVLGEATANHLGVRVQRVKNCAVLTVAAATGASVAVAGGIGFVGIVVPHLLRLTIGPEHRYLLPASALLGACLLLLADAASRMVVAPAELPIGIVTATLGAPFFLWILLRQRGLLDL
ncbi:FecCD family ABC transporter permease [Nitratireductor kimnyeongensis]|uniref:FecCD family ABC transporter permease n=1 Tax=Nitratireductor kimnyeongensis TaxID=430679 RepID=A0ABW0T393_9HYPH|nr:iron ABC transporter permease [Nitratireductor kimnyeongensis]QZZ35360.1 iron ABC transporter permease [Nitratireductor kimnyeongensis]